MASVNCPKCPEGELERMDTEEGFEIDICGGCGLYWFEKGELADELCQVADLPHPEDSVAFAEKAKFTCPKCIGSPLVEFSVHPPEGLGGDLLFLDFCAACHGIALDVHGLPLAKEMARRHGLLTLKSTLDRLIHRGHSMI